VTTEAALSLLPGERRRLIAVGLTRALLATLTLLGLYYWLPLDRLAGVRCGSSW